MGLLKSVLRRGWVVLLPWLVISGRAAPADYVPDLRPLHVRDAVAASNWWVEVRAVLPADVLGQPDLGLQQITNALCEQSRRGNLKAQAFWALTMLMGNPSREKVANGLQLLQASANKGGIDSMLLLGVLYQHGQVVPHDYAKSFQWYSEAAKQTNGEGIYQQGICYENGWGTTPDPVMALKCYERAATLMNYNGMQAAGVRLLRSTDGSANVSRALQWLKQSATDGGNPEAMYDLGVYYGQDPTNGAAMAEAFRWFKTAAEKNGPKSSYELARFYYNGLGGVTVNMASYRYWLMRAAMLGNTEAQYDLGVIYLLGQGVPRDPSTAVFWLQKAAAKNDPRACFELAQHLQQGGTNAVPVRQPHEWLLRAAEGGHREAQLECAFDYFDGTGVPVDPATGQRWLITAAKAGWPTAEYAAFRLYHDSVRPEPGQLYDHGVPPQTNSAIYPQDKAEGIKWLRQAAKDGLPKAQSTLAVMLLEGKDVEKNPEAAEKLLRQMVERISPEGDFYLGEAMLKGEIPVKDPVETAFWCQLGQSNYDPAARGRAHIYYVNALGKLSDEQKLELRRRIDNFHPSPSALPDPLLPGWRNNPKYQPED